MNHLDATPPTRALALCLLLLTCTGCEPRAPAGDEGEPGPRAEAARTEAAAKRGKRRLTPIRVIRRDLERAAKPKILQRKLENHPSINHHEWQEDGSVKVWAYGGRPPFIFRPDFKNRHPMEHKHDYESADIFGP